VADLAVPARCAHRPLVGGRVVPHVSVTLADCRPVFGAVPRSKALRCITDGLCQICGQKLGRPVVVLATAVQVEERYTAEAALHPECAAYSAKACPVVAGERTGLRAPDRHIEQSCNVADCGCAGWVDTEGGGVRGRPVGPWFAVWLDTYEIGVDEHGQVQGLAWRRFEPRRVRPVGGGRG